jgi:hypothetical protein
MILVWHHFSNLKCKTCYLSIWGLLFIRSIHTYIQKVSPFSFSFSNLLIIFIIISTFESYSFHFFFFFSLLYPPFKVPLFSSLFRFHFLLSLFFLVHSRAHTYPPLICPHPFHGFFSSRTALTLGSPKGLKRSKRPAKKTPQPKPRTTLAAAEVPKIQKPLRAQEPALWLPCSPPNHTFIPSTVFSFLVFFWQGSSEVHNEVLLI